MIGSVRSKSLSSLAILAAVVAVLSGCPKKAEVTAIPEAQQEDAARAAEEQAAAEARKGEEAKRAAEAEAEARERAATAAPGLQPVYFDYDRSVVRDDAKDVMKVNAEWLKGHPKVKVRIEGNCDERGTREYNQALGQRRAQTAKKYLTDLGISARRISLISYGKEKPVCMEATEDCMQKNRRDDFVAVE